MGGFTEWICWKMLYFLVCIPSYFIHDANLFAAYYLDFCVSCQDAFSFRFLVDKVLFWMVIFSFVSTIDVPCCCTKL